MQQATEARRPSRAGQEPDAAIPKFRELRLSAVVAACAWPRDLSRGRAKRDEAATVRIAASRFEEG